MYRITSEGTYAFNRITRERMDKPKWPDYREYAHDSDWYPAYYRYVSAMKVWDAFVKALPDDYTYKRLTLTHATEKGVPVPNISSGGRRKYVNGSGVSSNSRVLSHYYADEGEKGRFVRKLVRNRERALWLSEWQEEQSYDEYDAETVAQWFYDNSSDMDSDVIPSVYTVGETVVEWPSDYYGEYDRYDYDPGPYSIDDYVDFDPYDFDGYADYCAYCGGPCVMD